MGVTKADYRTEACPESFVCAHCGREIHPEEQAPITGIIVRIAFTVFMWMRREETGALPAMGKWSPLLSFREKTEIGVFYTAAHVAGS